ncbi:hypothetical protein RHSIM_Rhsim13G0029500 [Rhododendron simsii]|uniref:Protein transport protein Sec24-like At3g07100 n=1 Tax=Rhododendron simsii TaxID=118357 RepID=A0A834G112_RHOSS|nr:hypothetical protein RHSIM_Rhsim13G0029500 [Rhododendron simsii]
MNTMGTENSNSGNFPQRPASSPPTFVAASQSTTSLLSSGPVIGPEASAFRSTTPIAFQTSRPFLPSAPVVGPGASGTRPTQTGRYNDPSMPPPQSSHATPGVGSFKRFWSPQFPSTGQLAPPHISASGRPVFLSPIRQPAGHVPSLSVSPPLRPQIPFVSMGSPPQSINQLPSGMNIPPSSLDSSFSAPRPTLQTSCTGFLGNPPNAVIQPPPVQSAPFVTHQGSFGPVPPTTSASFPSHQGGNVPPPPVAAPLGVYSREHIRHQGSGPPMGAVQGLAEDFSSLSVASVPGSIDPGLDSKALPRPLDGDVEPKSFADMYPLNCDSRYVRFTTCTMPNSQSLVSRWHLPLGAVVCPLAEAPDGEVVPVVNFTPSGIIRCRRCRTYVNPYVTFTDGGRKWRCNICAWLNDVSGDYFAHLDASGKRVDLNERPELTKGSVEFIAPVEYMHRRPMPPLYFFLIDVSISAVKSGMLEVVAQTVKSCLDRLPGYPRTRVGFITFDSTLHFYNMKASKACSLVQPQMMVVSDLDDLFAPLPDDLLVNLSESRIVADAFLDSLSSMFQDNVNVESAFGPALKAAHMVMRQLGGKLLIFQNMLPSLGVGRLRLRGDDLRVYGTDKEHALRRAEDPFYKQMAADCTKYQISVNIYAFSDKYTDIASLGTLAKYTGGQVCYYPSFHSAIHKEKLRHELARDLTRDTAWEAIMRIRCGKGSHSGGLNTTRFNPLPLFLFNFLGSFSSVWALELIFRFLELLGLRVTSYHGNFMLHSTDIIALPAVDCDKAFAMQLTLEETLLTTQTVYFQVGLLYPSLHAKEVQAWLSWHMRMEISGRCILKFVIVSSCICHTCTLPKKTITCSLEDEDPNASQRYALACNNTHLLLEHEVKFTSSSGERRIRVHTAAIPVVADRGEMYRQADTGAVVSLLCRLAIEKTLSYKLEEARNSIQQRIIKALKEYRNLYAGQHRLVGRMIYPESLKFLPLYGLALCKSIPLRGGYPDAQLDERCAAGHTMMTLPVKNLLQLLYPNLVRIDEFLAKAYSKANEFKVSRLPLTAESLDSRGLYIYNGSYRFVIWFGRMLSPDIAMNLLGQDFATDLSKVILCERDGEMSRKLMAILEKIRVADPSYYQLCHLVRQGEQPREGFFLLANLVEDQAGGMNGYLDWILQIHRQVQQNP